jgi:hypothetical protein
MIESAASIKRLEAGVRRRLQLLAIQDLIALSVLVSAGVVLIALLVLKLGLFQNRIGEGIGTGGRLLLCGIPLAAAGVVEAVRRFLRKRGGWRSNLDAEADHTDLIMDQALGLDDRVRAAGSIIRRGGPAALMETAVIEDAANRLAGSRPEQFVGYRPPRLDSAVRCYTSLACSIVLALVALIALIQYRLAGYSGQGVEAEALVVMQAVGNDLERTTESIGESVAPGTPTAELAKQQADLARALKEAGTPGNASRTRPIGRAEALKELSAIGEKLDSRKNELENTRAPEILSLAERRLQSALSTTTSLRHEKGARDGGAKPEVEGKNSRSANPGSQDDQSGNRKGPKGKASPRDKPNIAGNQSDTPSLAEKQSAAGKEAAADKAPDESSRENQRDLAVKRDDSGRPDGAESSSGRSAGSNAAGKEKASPPLDDSNLSQFKPDSTLQSTKDDGQSVSPQTDPSAGPLTGMLPNLSEDLIKKAAEMRADKLTPSDIEQFRKAAEGLLKDLSAKDLVNLANSKEIQQTLQQLARQVDPQQMEQLARQLLSQKEIRDELQAVRKLLMENRQAKETIAGFAEKAKEIAKQFQEQGYKPRGFPNDLDSTMGASKMGTTRGGSGAGNEAGSGAGGARGTYGARRNGSEALNGAGRSGQSATQAAKRESNSGWIPEGETIYGRTRPGSAPARVPYFAAYPGYRREAERSVQRSQVPPRLRGLIRNYFDAINPDTTKKP